MATSNNWVSEGGTIDRLAIRNEPYSQNEMKNRQPKKKRDEPRMTTMAGNEQANVEGSEATGSADQRDAARSNLADMATSATGFSWGTIKLGVGAFIAAAILHEVLY